MARTYSSGKQMNPVLTKIIQESISKCSPQNKNPLQKAVLAGKKLMMDQQTHNHMTLQKDPASRAPNVIATTISTGVTGLGWIMYKISKHTMSIEVLVLSGIILMCWAIDFAERAYGVKFNNDMIGDCTKKLSANLMVKLNISHDQLNEQIRKGYEEQQAHLRKAE